MNRALCFATLAGYLLTACDDGSLRAFEPKILALGGSAGGGGKADGGGGRGGTGGAAAAAGAGGATSPLLIDDFEDGDTSAKKPLGWWYPVNDGTGTQGFGIEPVTRGAASIYALRTHGSGFREWGSAVGVDLVGEAGPLDLLSYHDLCFIGRVEAGSSTLIQVHLLSGSLHYTREVTLSETWNRYCLPLTDFMNLTQEALVPNQVLALQFFFAPTEPFLFWLDDVEVVRN
jgi:hypothetical protein